MPDEPLTSAQLDTLCARLGDLNRAAVSLRIRLAESRIPRALLTDPDLDDATRRRLLNEALPRLAKVLEQWQATESRAHAVEDALKTP